MRDLIDDSVSISKTSTFRSIRPVRTASRAEARGYSEATSSTYARIIAMPEATTEGAILASGSYIAAKDTDPKIKTFEELGWTPEKVVAMQLKFAAVLDDWDDPSMDVYDDI